MYDYGILKQRRVFKKSPLIGKNSTKAYLTWPSILQDLILQVQELMLWPKFLFENSSQWKIIIFRSEIWKESRNLPRYSRVPKWIIMLWWWKNELIKITKRRKNIVSPVKTTTTELLLATTIHPLHKMVTKKDIFKKNPKKCVVTDEYLIEYWVPSTKPTCMPISLLFYIPETIRNCSAGVLQKSLVTLHNCQHTSESEKKRRINKKFIFYTLKKNTSFSSTLAINEQDERIIIYSIIAICSFIFKYYSDSYITYSSKIVLSLVDIWTVP